MQAIVTRYIGPTNARGGAGKQWFYVPAQEGK